MGSITGAEVAAMPVSDDISAAVRLSALRSASSVGEAIGTTSRAFASASLASQRVSRKSATSSDVESRRPGSFLTRFLVR